MANRTMLIAASAAQTAISVLPESVLRLRQLEELDATKTQIDTWPDWT
ncbi:MAG: hypothetical protein AAFV32_05925 [Myxococcota bacterium]